ncbi:hypothetical protein F8568_033475 [Actinomadura sp. LD22]|uniref:Uncharacterized protein n=1 Tax=Actinomadura physcomitrii TaxID=2650748 RepID=A0A6I4MP27_9ACTN|nr:hypothetical protein [Actinomadura physcomitrii]MWA05191.1 hypothetical protein [Actinomadura physcomitrii]
MRPRMLLAGFGIAAVTAGFTTATAHAAAPGTVDGTLAALGYSCGFTAATSDTPPNTLTIDQSTVVPDCGGGVQLTLGNSPTFTFDDTAGTASAAEIDLSGGALGITCTYQVSDATLTRSGTTRTYNGGPFTATKTAGSGLCPATTSVDTATFDFH